MEVMKKMKKNNKGFTLAELLIVVAIIAVLVAIAIPVFTTRLEQSRETADIANLRSAYAAAQVAALSGDKDGKPMKDGVSYYYDANDDIGLKEGAKPANGIGKGTATEGKADSSALPSMVSYKGSSDVRSQFIKVTYESGKVSKVVFSN
jgi:type IV pilus assembly protein PilA